MKADAGNPAQAPPLEPYQTDAMHTRIGTGNGVIGQLRSSLGAEHRHRRTA